MLSTRLKSLLFAVLLLLAQVGALTHATEHLRLEAAPAGDPVCALCIAAQGLDASLISLAVSLPLSVAEFSLLPGVIVPSGAVSAVSPCARAPPTAD
jgi:hypothetical protein